MDPITDMQGWWTWRASHEAKLLQWCDDLGAAGDERLSERALELFEGNLPGWFARGSDIHSQSFIRSGIRRALGRARKEVAMRREREADSLAMSASPAPSIERAAESRKLVERLNTWLSRGCVPHVSCPAREQLCQDHSLCLRVLAIDVMCRENMSQVMRDHGVDEELQSRVRYRINSHILDQLRALLLQGDPMAPGGTR